MRRAFFTTMALFGALAFCQGVLGQPPGGPSKRPDPHQLFQRIDRNNDGKVTRDEVPERAPERIKALLRRADTDNDGAVSFEEFEKGFAAVARRLGRPDGPPRAGQPGFGPPRGDRPAGPPRAERGPEGPRPVGPQARGPRPERAVDGPPRFGPPMAPPPRGPEGEPGRYARGARGPSRIAPHAPGGRFVAVGRIYWRGGPPSQARGRFGPPPWAGRGAMGPHRPGRFGHGQPFGGPSRAAAPGRLPDPKAIFARLDKDSDGQLSEAEFTAGMRAFHSMQKGRRPAAGHRLGPPHGPRAAAGKRPMPPRGGAVDRPGPPPNAGPPDRGFHGRGPKPDRKRGGPPPEDGGDDKAP